jgi:TPR repeat protein
MIKIEKNMETSAMHKICRTLLLAIMLLPSVVLSQSDFEATKARAEAGDAEAQNKLGDLYFDGTGVPENDQEAVKWYRLAAEQGYAEAQYNFGLMYYIGAGVIKNNQEAARWYKLAAEQGNDRAQYSLGFLYQYGEGFARNYQEAVRLYRLAAEQGNIMAQSFLGLMYLAGQGVAQSNSRAYVWLSVAAAQEQYADGAARAARDRLRDQLSPQALEAAQAQATRCFESNYKDCGE